MTPAQIFWLAALVVFLIVEGATVQLVSIWFAFGAFAALIASVFHAQMWLQITLFLVVSVAALILTRPLVKKRMEKGYKPTNADRVIGKPCYVTETIDNIVGTGKVSDAGKIWTARSKTGEVLTEGSLVRPVLIEGVKLIVVPIIKEETKEEVKEEVEEEN